MKTWKKHLEMSSFYMYVPKITKSQSYDVCFLRYRVYQTEIWWDMVHNGQTDRHIEVGAPTTYNTQKTYLSLPKNLTLLTFGKLLIVFSTKVNLFCLLYSTTQMCCCLPDTAKLFAKNFFENSDLEFLPFTSLIWNWSETDLKLSWNCIVFM